MEITYLGMNSVKLSGKAITVLCDPAPKSAGLGDIKGTIDATLLTVVGQDTPAKPGMVIDGPGEYEVRGAMITGAPARLHTDAEEKGRQATVYAIQIDGIQVGFLGNIAPELSDDQIEALGAIDVLIVPVGNHGLTLDSVSATKIISQLEPKYVVPVHYDDGLTKYEVPQDKVEVFLKEIGSKPEPQPKLKLSAKDLPLETTVVVLEPQKL